jgi:hypothetical protein
MRRGRRSRRAPIRSDFRRALRSLGLSIALALLASGCATYTDRMQDATQAVQAGAYATSLESLNKALRVDSEQELPGRWRSTDALTVLERGIVLQSLGRYKESSRDLSAAEQEIELLDLRRNGVDALGKYLYSDASGKYKARSTCSTISPTETSTGLPSRRGDSRPRASSSRPRASRPRVRRRSAPTSRAASSRSSARATARCGITRRRSRARDPSPRCGRRWRGSRRPTPIGGPR